MLRLNERIFRYRLSPETFGYTLAVNYRRVRWARHVVRIGETRTAYKILAGKLLGKWPLGRPV